MPAADPLHNSSGADCQSRQMTVHHLRGVTVLLIPSELCAAHKRMLDAASDIRSNDVAIGVDPKGPGQRREGKINRGEFPPSERKKP